MTARDVQGYAQDLIAYNEARKSESQSQQKPSTSSAVPTSTSKGSGR